MKKSLMSLIVLFGLLAGLQAKTVKQENISYQTEKSSVAHVQATKANLVEGFEGTVFPPDGWKVINGGDPNTWVRSTSSPIAGTASARIAYNSAAHDDYLITPPLVPATGNSSISFMAKNYNGSWMELFNVKLSTTGSNVEDFTVTLASDVEPPITPGQTYTYDLSAYIGQTVYIAVQATSTDMYYLFVDDFAGPPIYVTPTNLVTTGLNKSYAQIPQSQLSNALTLQALVRNTGDNLVDPVNVDFSLADAAKAVLFTSTKPLTVPMANATEQTITADAYNSTGLPIGNYVMNYSAPYAADFDPVNNTDAFNFAVTDYMYARDNGVIAGGVGNTAAITFGTIYEITNPATWSGVEIAWGAGTTALNFNVALYSVDADNAVLSTIYTSGALAKTTTDAGTSKLYPVAPIALSAGKYMLCVKQLTTTNIGVGYDGKSYGALYIADNAATPTAFGANTSFGNIGIRMELAPRRIVGFNVNDGTNPIANAIITVKQGATTVSTATTNALGLADSYLLNGSYTYSVTAVGYNTQSDVALTVAGDTPVNIVMTVAAPTFSIDPTVKDFGTIAINTTSPAQIFTISNVGSGTLTINPADITLTNDLAGNFTLTNITETQNLTVGQSFTVSVVFNPTTAGTKTAELQVQDNLTKVLNTVQLSGDALDPTIVSFPHTQSFDSATLPVGWLNQRVAGTSTPGTFVTVTSGTNPTIAAPYDGSHMLKYNCWDYSTGTQAILATPKIVFTNNYADIDFWMYRDNGYLSNADKIEVYVSDDQTLTSTSALLLGTVNRATTLEPVVAANGWYHYVFEANLTTKADKYFILKAYSAYGDNMFLDLLTINQFTSSSIDNEMLPKVTTLAQNYPNPFNPSTAINFALAKDALVNLTVFNAKGEMVRNLVNTNVKAGYHSVNFNAQGLNSGVYFYKLSTPETSLTQKMLLVK